MICDKISNFIVMLKAMIYDIRYSESRTFHRAEKWLDWKITIHSLNLKGKKIRNFQHLDIVL